MTNCTNCGAEAADVYCARCGEKQPDPHDMKVSHFAHDVVHELVHLDSKLFLTLKELVRRPGFLTQEYFAGRKKRYVAPLRLFLTLFALQFIAFTAYKPVAMYSVETLVKFDKTGDVYKWMQRKGKKYNMTAEQYMERVDERLHKNLSLLQLASILGVAVVLKIVHRRRYYVEHLVFASHYLAFSYLFSLALWPAYLYVGLTPGMGQRLLSVFGIIVSIVYLYLAQRRFYGDGRVKSGVKTALVLLGAQIVLMFILVGSVIAAMIQYR